MTFSTKQVRHVSVCALATTLLGCSGGTTTNQASGKEDSGPHTKATQRALPSSPWARGLLDHLRERFTLEVHPRLNLPGNKQGHPGARASSSPTRLTVLRAAVASQLVADSEQIVPQFSKTHLAHVMTPASVRLSARANGSFVLKDEHSGVSVAVSLRGASKTEAQVADGYVIYPNVLGAGAHVLHRPMTTGTEDYLVMPRAPEGSAVSYRLKILEGVAGLRLVENTLEMLDETGAPRLRMAPPYIVDSAGSRHDAQVSVVGCHVSTDPSAPWGKPVEPAGADACEVRIS